MSEMMSSMPHRGRWQAQGADITRPRGGHSVAWNTPEPPSKQDGVAALDALSELCTPAQRSLRTTVWSKAKRWVERAPSGGYSTVGSSKSFYVQPPDRKYKDARVDLEIKAGLAFAK